MSKPIKLGLIVLLIGVITTLHYTTSTSMHSHHDIYRRFYYIPIILGGLWFNLSGGIAVALLVSLAYIPHVLWQWNHLPATSLDQYLEILLYNIIGLLTGFLASREQQQKRRLERATKNLEESYSKLRTQADLLIKTEDQLRRADRLTALGELSASMAHEIRNPLGSIRGTAEILREGFDNKDKRYEFAEILVKEVNRLDTVVHDFLNFARPHEGERKIVAIDEALHDVITLTRQQALKAGVKVDLNGTDSPLEAIGNLEQYKQAILNLVLNAVQAMPEGGALTINCTTDSQHICIDFADTGPGIPEDIQDRIFNPFYTTRNEGTGLGLSITQRIISAHGGKLSVTSEPGKRSIFHIELPRWKRK